MVSSLCMCIERVRRGSIRVVSTAQTCVGQFLVAPLLAISLSHRPTWAWGHLSLQPVVQVIESVQRPRASDSIRELGKTIDVS